MQRQRPRRRKGDILSASEKLPTNDGDSSRMQTERGDGFGRGRGWGWGWGREGGKKEKGSDGWLVEAHRLQATNYLNAKPKSLCKSLCEHLNWRGTQTDAGGKWRKLRWKLFPFAVTLHFWPQRTGGTYDTRLGEKWDNILWTIQFIRFGITICDIVVMLVLKIVSSF